MQCEFRMNCANNKEIKLVLMIRALKIEKRNKIKSLKDLQLNET